jgi:hypothetical protein
MTSHADEQKLRADTFENDRKVREQASTMFEHAVLSADDDRGGRFAGVNKTIVVGASPVAYPPLPASSPWHGPDPVGPEPPLGYSVNDLEPSALRDPAEEPGPVPAAAPSTNRLDDLRAGAGPSLPPGEPKDAA